MALPDNFDLNDFVRGTLAEDLGIGGDVTSRATIPENAHFVAQMNARQEIVVAGIEIASAFFHELDPDVEIERLVEDGTRVPARTVLLRLHGNARAMLAAERSALNTLQHLSGIATLARTYVDAIDGTGAVVIDTRKTIPGLRALEKYAVRMGGAHNHRMRLDDGVLIKDNHIRIAKGITNAVTQVRAWGSKHPVEVEVTTLEEVDAALDAKADILLLDNMTTDVIREAVRRSRGRAKTEISGGVTLGRIPELADTGADYVSSGALTHSAPAVDISFEIEPV